MRKRDLVNYPVYIFIGLIIIIILISHSLTTRKSLKNQTSSILVHAGTVSQSSIDSLLDFAINSIDFVSYVTADKMKEDHIFVLDNLESVNNLYIEKTPFDFIEYIPSEKLVPDSELYNEDRKNTYYIEGIKGKTGFCLDYSLTKSDENLLVFYSPLIINKQVVGILAGFICSDTRIRPMMESVFYGYHTIGVLMDKDYKVITTNYSEFSGSVELLNFKDSSKFVEDLVQHSKENNTEPFTFLNAQNRLGLACVTNLSHDGLSLCQIVRPVVYTAQATKIALVNVFFTGIIILLLIGLIFYQLFLSKERAEEFSETQKTIIQALCSEYQTVALIDEKTGDANIFQLNRNVEKRFGDYFSKNVYEDGLLHYVNTSVAEDDKRFFEDISTIQKVKSILEHSMQFSFIYRASVNGNEHYIQCAVIKSSIENEFVIAFKNVDNLMLKWMTAEKKSKTLIQAQEYHLSILSSIAGIYNTMHLIDFETDKVTELSTTKEVHIFSEEKKTACEKMEYVVRKSLTDENLERALVFTDLKTIQRRLGDKIILSEEFEGIRNGWFRASFITVEKDNTGRITKVLFVTQLINEEKNRENRLIKKANTDGLTNCLNRHAYEDDIKKYETEPIEDNLALVSVDINELKSINDTLGHEAGDELINNAALVLKKCLSKYGKIYRTGGDEFISVIFVAPNLVEGVKKEIQDAVSRCSGKLVDHISISVGIVHRAEVPEATISEIENIADKRMYNDKAIYYANKGIDRRGQQSAFNVICRSYTKILKVNLTADDYSIVQLNSSENDLSKGFNEKISIWLHDFGTSGQITSEDLDLYLEKTDINYLRKYFSNGNSELVLQYNRKIDNQFHKVLMEMVKALEYSEENQIVYLYVKNLE